MKLDRKAMHKQRLMTDKKLRCFRDATHSKPPRNGWLKTVRESLGMTAAQLAKRLGVSQPTVTQLESREKTGKATLEKLDEVARAMDCQLVYAILPKEKVSLQKLLERRAEEVVRRNLEGVSHSMGLEMQKLSPNEQKAQVKRLKQELVESLNSQIWDED